MLVQHPSFNDESLHSLAMIALARTLVAKFVERGWDAESVALDGFTGANTDLLLTRENSGAGEERRTVRWSLGEVMSQDREDEILQIVSTPRQYAALVTANQAVAFLDIQGGSRARVELVHHALYVARPGGQVPLLLASLIDAGVKVRNVPRRSALHAAELPGSPRTERELIGMLDTSRNLLLEADIDGSIDPTATCLAVLAQLLGCRVAIIGARAECPGRPTSLPVFSEVEDIQLFLATHGEPVGHDELLDSLLTLIDEQANGTPPPLPPSADDPFDHARFIAESLDERLAESQAMYFELEERLLRVQAADAASGRAQEIDDLASYALALERELGNRERGIPGRVRGVLRWAGHILVALVTGRQPLVTGRALRPPILDQYSWAEQSTMRPAGLVGQPGGRSRKWLRVLPAFLIARLRAALRTAREQRPTMKHVRRGSRPEQNSMDAEYWKLQAKFALEELEYERGLRNPGSRNMKDES